MFSRKLKRKILVRAQMSPWTSGKSRKRSKNKEGEKKHTQVIRCRGIGVNLFFRTEEEIPLRYGNSVQDSTQRPPGERSKEKGGICSKGETTQKKRG